MPPRHAQQATQPVPGAEAAPPARGVPDRHHPADQMGPRNGTVTDDVGVPTEPVALPPDAPTAVNQDLTIRIDEGPDLPATGGGGAIDQHRLPGERRSHG